MERMYATVVELIQKIAYSQPMFYVRFRIKLTSWVNRISALLNDTVCKRYISSNNQVALLNQRNDMIICHIESRRYPNTRNIHRLRNLQMLVRDQNQRNTNALNCPEQDIHDHTGKCISIDEYLHSTPFQILNPIILFFSQVLREGDGNDQKAHRRLFYCPNEDIPSRTLSYSC